jgi:nitrate/TMAO reductase-like tetraheme cytochrome c subunit
LLHAAATLLIALLASGCEQAANPPPPAASAAAPAAPHAASVQPAPVSYHAAKYDPIHFKPAIETATDQQCLACHAEVLKPALRKTSPAGLESAAVQAWYQQLSTYAGEQDTFHRRHLETAYAKQVMNLRCTTCHQGNDPRDRAPGSSATAQADLTLRKTVSAESTCLKCHGQMNWPVMGLPGPWREVKDTFQNNCLLCHAAFRTVRHQVTYLNAKAIEELAAKPDGGDVCFGCHGGRAWYRINYPYPRHPWPDMPTEIPDWAKERPTQSEARFIIAASQGEQK